LQPSPPPPPLPLSPPPPPPPPPPLDSDPFSQLAELVEELQLPLANLCEGSWAATSAQVNEVVEAKIEAAFEKIAERIRQQLQRPRENEIPRLFGRGMHAAFENVWPDLREMLLEYAMSGVERSLTRVRKDLPLKPPPSQPPSRLARVRNRLLYTLYPYDRSFLSQCCQWQYWLLFGTQCVAYFGISSLFFLTVGARERHRSSAARASPHRPRPRAQAA